MCVYRLLLVHGVTCKAAGREAWLCWGLKPFCTSLQCIENEVMWLLNEVICTCFLSGCILWVVW
jgi:hypothetical protein